MNEGGRPDETGSTERSLESEDSDSVAALAQGDVVRAADIEQGALPDWAADEELWILATQTCDIRDAEADGYVQVCPCVELPPEQARIARKHWLPQYAPVPGVDEHFADLSRVVSIPKRTLRTASVAGGCGDDGDRHRFGRSIARRFGRFAFPDGLNEVLRRFRQRLRTKHGKESIAGRIVEEIAEIRVTAWPDWDADVIDLHIALLVSSDILSRTKITAEDLEAERVGLESLCQPGDKFREIRVAVMTTDSMTVEEYLNSAPLDLDNVSR